MKFAYVDESGNGAEPFLVAAAVVVDASRMHVTKAAWGDLFTSLSSLAGRTIPELKASDLYSGRRLWRDVDGAQRAASIGAILDWVHGRRHQILFTAIDKGAFATAAAAGTAGELPDAWCAAAFHLVLQLQKAGRGAVQPKGHFALIFDAQVQHVSHFLDLVRDPPAWSDEYYGRGRREQRLSRLVDVPYFADSEHVLLIQVADLIAFVLRRHAELCSGVAEAYAGEQDRVRGWAELVASQAGAPALRWKQRAGNGAERIYNGLAPAGLRALRTPGVDE